MARPVRFNIHPIKADIKDNISLVDIPEGHMGDGFFATNLSKERNKPMLVAIEIG